MQGYLLPIVLAGLLAIPLLWRIGSDTIGDPDTLAEKPTGDGTPTTVADDGEEDSRSIRSFSLGDSELKVEFPTAEELFAKERERARELKEVGFGKPEADD